MILQTSCTRSTQMDPSGRIYKGCIELPRNFQDLLDIDSIGGYINRGT